ncbi:MAG: peptidylprolyl isomerase [Clostridia bacterium]|nr:peptidylprolyl isomerase [Clostridia bacterium]
MKRIISLILALALVGTTAVFAHPFSDVSGHWAEAEIEKGYNNKAINGDPDGRFRPDDIVTRGEFMKMLTTMVCKVIEFEIPEDWSSGNHWASKYYSFARMFLFPPVAQEVDGVKGGAMENDEDYDLPISRWEMAYMSSYSVISALGYEMSEKAAEFADKDEIDQYPVAIVETIATSNELGIMKGDENSNFVPKANGTRAEAVTVINRVNSLINKAIGEYTEETQSQQESYYKDIDENRVTYDKIPTGHPKVTILMANNKKIVVELYPEYAPQTVANFIKLAKDGFYNGTTFHRVVKGFMAQGGDPNGDGTGGSGKYILGEFSSNSFSKNTLSHTKGVISMARSQHPDSASSQFFICLEDAPHLDGQYAAFGKVIQGMDVVEEFAEVEMTINSTGELASPVKPITIKSITVK